MRSHFKRRHSKIISPLSVIARSLSTSAACVAGSSDAVTSTGADGTTTSPPRRLSATASAVLPVKKRTPRIRRWC